MNLSLELAFCPNCLQRNIKTWFPPDRDAEHFQCITCGYRWSISGAERISMTPAEILVKLRSDVLAKRSEQDALQKTEATAKKAD